MYPNARPGIILVGLGGIGLIGGGTDAAHGVSTNDWSAILRPASAIWLAPVNLRLGMAFLDAASSVDK